MRGVALLLGAVVILAGIVAFTAPAPLHADDSAAPIFVTQIPPGYRDWRLISVSHEAGNLNSIG
ncbi:MAG: cytochrome P460, partial [Bryobacteraceae bacterium]